MLASVPEDLLLLAECSVTECIFRGDFIIYLYILQLSIILILMEKMTVTLDEVNSEKAIDFFNIYEVELVINFDDLTKKIYVGEFANRVCRFCGKAKPAVSFKKEAHVVPQFLGNRFLLSAQECDICNKLFGDLYENDFANYIGALRPFSFFTPSKNNKNPKYKESLSVGNEKKLGFQFRQVIKRI